MEDNHLEDRIIKEVALLGEMLEVILQVKEAILLLVKNQ